MTDPTQRSRPSRRAGKSAEGLDWSRLFVRESPEAAMEEIRRTAAGDPAPGWTGEALGAWKAAREQLARIETRLEARTRELGLLQTLGQKAAEAQSHDGLFRIATEVLQAAAEVELIVVLHRLQGSQDARCYLARPVDGDLLRTLVQESARFLDWKVEEGLAPRTEPLSAFDEGRWPLRSFKETDLVMLPVLRRGDPVACLTLLHAGSPDEGRLRVLYSAANLLSLHIDRILTVQEAERDRFRFILDSMPQAVILTDPSLHVVQANPSARRLLDRLGFAGGGGRLERLADLNVEALAGQVASGATAEASSEIRLDEGAILTVSLSAFRSGRGEPEGFVVVLADVTESRKLQEQLAQAEKMSSLGQMISGVAHELNNPLASILGYAQLVKATAPDPTLADRLDVLHKEARRCQRIVSNLLSFARRHEPETKPLAVNQTVRAVVSLMAYQLRVDGVSVETQLDPDLPSIQGDVHQIQQALLNLFTNAHHAMKEVEGDHRIRVETRALEGDDAVELVVEDTGPGIPGPIRSRIFDPFFTTKAPGEGTGLGLSLVYGTITAHGGTIQAGESGSGGARFLIRLPVGDTGAERNEAPADEAVTNEPSGGEILVVDDESNVASLMRDTLESWGHRVTVTPDGEQALKRLGDGRYDLVIMDYRMPVMDGQRLHEEIRARHPSLRTRLILTTGDTVSGEPEKLARRGGMPVLRKPFALDELRRAVRERLLERPESSP